MKLSGLLALVTLLAGSTLAHTSAQPLAPALYTYDAALRERFADPDTVQFRNVKPSADGRSVCGEVNGRGRHGSYLGFERFRVYGGNGSYMVLLSDGEGDAAAFTCD